MLRKLSLFSGIGGDDLASEWAGIETVCMVEKDEYCRQVLKKNFPGIPIIEDIKYATKETITDTIIRAERTAYRAPSYSGRSDNQQQNGNGLGNDTGNIREVTPDSEGRESGEPETWNRRESLGGRSESSTTLAHSHDRGYSGIMGEKIPGRKGSTDTDTEPRSGSTTRIPIQDIDIISGGFPCQPHSVAGKRQGADDERDLWPEFRRVIGEIKPRWVVAENVPGLRATKGVSIDNRFEDTEGIRKGIFFRNFLTDLAKMGYSVGWCDFAAADLGAWHRRNRVFTIAWNAKGNRSGAVREVQERKDSDTGGIYTTESFSNSERCDDRIDNWEGGQVLRDIRTSEESEQERKRWFGRSREIGEITADTIRERGCSGNTEREDAEDVGQFGIYQGYRGRFPESGLGGLVYGISYWMDEPGMPRVATGIKNRNNRIKGLGNAVVPQQIYLIYKAIVEIENMVRTT